MINQKYYQLGKEGWHSLVGLSNSRYQVVESWVDSGKPYGDDGQLRLTFMKSGEMASTGVWCGPDGCRARVVG